MSFAHSKIQPPQPRQGLLLPRPALERRLLEALGEHRVVLVQAPAGYGKTALLVHALGQRPPGEGTAWVSLDPGDDLHRLLECLLAALEPFDPPWRVAPEAILATALQGEPRARQLAVDELVNALDACELAHGALVLDDVHHLADEAGGHFLQRLAERLGPRWTLVLASRHELPFGLARLGAAGELALFGQADLQFSLDEVRALLARQAPGVSTSRAASATSGSRPAPNASGLAFDEATVVALHARTAGWAAGLRLALTGARGGHPGSAIDRQTFEFLTTEVLARIDPDLRAFLIGTSVLPELDEARCRALTGDPRSAAWLDDVERLGLFASVVDEATHTLRLHDLFREALQHRLRIERGSGAWQALLEQAAAGEPDPLRRIGLLLQAQRHEAAAAALPAIGWQLLFQGGTSTLLRLCEQFPAEVAAASAPIQQVLGLARWHSWDVRTAERHFAQAEALHAQRGDATGEATARGFRAVTLLSQGRLQTAQALVARLRAGLGGQQPVGPRSSRPSLAPATAHGATAPATTPADEAERRGRSDARLATLLAEGWLAVESGSYDDVAPRFAALLDMLEAENRLEHWWLVIPSPRIAACRGMDPLLGRWAAGVRAATGDKPLPLHTLALLALGWQALWRGRLDEAAAALHQADASASWTGQHVIARSHALALRALLQALGGDTAEALGGARARVESFPAGYGDWGRWQMLFFAAKIAALCSDFAAMRGWLAELEALGPTIPEIAPEQRHPVLGLRGLLAWHEGRAGEAEAHWREALAREERVDLFAQASELRVLLARAGLRRGDLAEAAAWLQPLLAPPTPQATAAAYPRGAVFAGEALRELAAADWQGRLGAPEVDTLRRWATALAQPSARERLGALAGATMTAATAAMAGDGAVHNRPGHGRATGVGGHRSDPHAPASAPDTGPGAAQDAIEALGPLTAREAEVLALVARGQSNKLIARALDLSPHTVKRHVANLLDKLAVASRSQAAAWYHAQRPAVPPRRR